MINLLLFSSAFNPTNVEITNSEEINKKILNFHAKSKQLSRLKKHFFEELESSIEKENVEKTILYYTAFLRTNNLSSKIYDQILEILHSHFDKFTYEAKDYQNQIKTFFNDYEKQIKNSENTSNNFDEIKAQKNILLASENNLNIFLSSFFPKLQSLLQNNKEEIVRIRNLIEEEKTVLKTLGEDPQNLFEKVKGEIMLHQKINEEEILENQINKQIDELIKSSLDFIGNNAENIKNEMNSFEKLITLIAKDYEHTKNDFSGSYNYLLGKGELLEKHASKFAATVVLLSAVSGIATAAGLGAAAAVFGTAFGIIATGGEALQMMPFLKSEVFSKADEKIKIMLAINSQAQNTLIQNQNNIN